METSRISLNDTTIRINLGHQIDPENQNVFGFIELDRSNKDDLMESIQESLADGKKRIVLDLSNVASIDSSGLGALVDGYKKAKFQNANFLLLNPTATVQKVFNMTRITLFLNLITEQEMAAVI